MIAFKGIALATVLIKKGSFEAGTSISVRWIPSPKEKPEVDSQSVRFPNASDYQLGTHDTTRTVEGANPERKKLNMEAQE